ncbi:hypothetical protein [Bhargavaea cecembensis]|uniref:hypothetical protein n=1 Tax=Bhargavaea cecembensis TaxID=394098 RepID=UPI00058C89CE|nr:hypothetical protein [Bhargavaea cecembensis]
MEKEVNIKILDIELEELSLKKTENRTSLAANKQMTYRIEGKVVSLICDFDFALDELRLKFIYRYVIAMESLEEKEIKQFIESEEDELLYPIYNKASALVSKLTDEVHTFPFAASMWLWAGESEV